MQTLKTGAGEKLYVLTQDEYEDMTDARDAAIAEAELASGSATLFSSDEVKHYLAAPTPLSFWRGYRKLSLADLAAAAHISPAQLADMEAGRMVGDVATYARLARHLRTRVDSLLPVEPEAP